MITGRTGPDSADSDTQSLSALVTGDPTPSIEWRRNGSPLSLDSRIASSSEIEGVGMRVTLTITMVTAADRGVYELLARNDGGEDIESWNVPVNCELPSSFLLFSSPSTVSLSLSLHSLVPHTSFLSSGGGQPAEDIQWQYKCHFHLHWQSVPQRWNHCEMGGREGGR